MYGRPLFSESDRPPETFDGEGFVARPLRLTDADADFDAVMASAAIVKGVFAPDDSWPDGLTIEENCVDLGWHEREFTLGHSFAWTILTPDTARTIGCAYLYPSDREGSDTMAFWWFCPGTETIAERFEPIFRHLIGTLPGRAAMPGRDISWTDWFARPFRHRPLGAIC